MDDPAAAEAVPSTTTAAASAGAAAERPAKRAKPLAEKVEKEEAKEIDLPLPTLNKLLKSAIPDAVVSKDAKTAFSKAAGIFVFYLTAAANDIVRERKAQTVQPQDIILALKELGFEAFVPMMNEVIEEQKEIAIKRKAQRKPKEVAADGAGEGEGGEAAGEGGEAVGEPEATEAVEAGEQDANTTVHEAEPEPEPEPEPETEHAENEAHDVEMGE